MLLQSQDIETTLFVFAVGRVLYLRVLAIEGS